MGLRRASIARRRRSPRPRAASHQDGPSITLMIRSERTASESCVERPVRYLYTSTWRTTLSSWVSFEFGPASPRPETPAVGPSDRDPCCRSSERRRSRPLGRLTSLPPSILPLLEARRPSSRVRERIFDWRSPPQLCLLDGLVFPSPLVRLLPLATDPCQTPKVPVPVQNARLAW